jgi:hypothetical protein
MHNASQPAILSTNTQLITLAQELFNSVNADAATLENIANVLLGIAQEKREQAESDLAEVERFEEEEAARFACDPDTREDRFLDSHWESLTDVGDFGGGDF